MSGAQKNALSVGALVVFSAALILAWVNFAQARSAGTELRRLAEKQKQIDARLHQIAAESASYRRGAAPAPATAPRSKDTASKPEKTLSIMYWVGKDPKLQILWLNDQRAQKQLLYGALFRKLGLSTEQIAQFVENVDRHEEQLMDLMDIYKSESGAGQRAAGDAIAREQVDYETAQRNLLGEGGYAQLTAYDQSSQARKIVSNLTGGLVSVAGEPLNSQQAEQLIQAITSANTNGIIDWDAVDAQAKAVLSDNQYTVYSTTEPPLPSGGRFQNRFSALANRAVKAESVGPGK